MSASVRSARPPSVRWPAAPASPPRAAKCPCRLPLHPPFTSTLRIIPSSTSTCIKREQTPFGRYVIVIATPPLYFCRSQYSRYGDIIPAQKPYILWRMRLEVGRYDTAAKIGLCGAGRVRFADRVGCGRRRAAQGPAAALVRPGAAAAGFGAHGARCSAGGCLPPHRRQQQRSAPPHPHRR